MRKAVRIISPCIADRYAGKDERIIEFSSARFGGLISFRELPDGTLRVEVYRADKGVIVRAGGQDVAAHYDPDKKQPAPLRRGKKGGAT